MIMKITDKKSKYHSIHISGNIFFIILISFVLIGVFVGSLFYREISAMDFISVFSITDFFCNCGENMPFWGCFLNSFARNAILMLIIFVSGMCPIAQLWCVAVLLYKGMVSGASLALAYSGFDMSSFFISVLYIIPDAVVSAFVLSLASREGIRFSNKLFRLVFNNKIDDDFNKNIKLYLLKFSVLFVIIIILSLVQSVLLLFVG